MKRPYRLPTGVALLGLLAITGCGPSTKLLHTWSDPTFKTNSLNKVVVLGIAKNSTIRRTYEDHFVTALKGMGTDALPSYPYTAEGQLDSSQVASKLAELQVDGIIVTRVTDKQTVDTYYPPTTSYVGVPSPYYGGWYGYYNMGYSYVSSPGYTVQSQVVNLETNLYRVSDGKLVWSGLSQTWLMEGDNPANEIDPFIGQIVSAMDASKVITKRKSKS
jgi:hypothetical protein